MEKIGYVYLTTNLVNGKQYVGQHLHDGFDVKYKGSGHYIKKAFDKYGWDNFDCKVICWCNTQTQLNEAEDNYIKLLNTMVPNGYNLMGGGNGGEKSKEARKNMSEAQKKRFEDPKERKNLSNKNKNKHLSKETRCKQSKALKGVPKSEEARKNMSIAQKGKKRSEETRKRNSVSHKKFYESEEGIKIRQQLSEINKDKVITKETRGKISKALKGLTRSEETRKKISNSLKGHTVSDEQRRKTSKKVYQYTKDGIFVKEWCSLSEIGRVLGLNIGCISECCNGKRKSSNGFLWSLKPLTPPNNPS